jgi:multisubunit Na+/H+ antiporter MnhF subunit
MEFRRYKWISFALSAIAVAWTAAVLSLYYFVHKPIASDQLAAIGRLGWMLVGLLGTLSLAFMLGSLWKRALSPLPAAEAMAIRVGAGLVTLSLLVLVLGAISAYRPPIATIAVLISLPVGLPGLIRALKEARIRPVRSRLDRLFALLVVIMVAIAFMRALTPPTAWDSLVYHLTGPQLYLTQGKLHHAVDLPYLGFPQGGSMLFLWALMLSSAPLAQVLHVTFAALTLVLVRSVALKIAPKTEWLSVALLVSIPSAALLASWAYVEWMSMFAAIAAFRLILHLNQHGSEGNGSYARLALIGVLLAFAFSTKYSAVGLLLGLGITLVIAVRSLRKIAVAALASAAFGAPFLLKNLILTGNPVYPFFFSGLFWDGLRADWYSRPGTGLSFARILSSPWDATIWGIEGATIIGKPSYGADIGPLLLLLGGHAGEGVSGGSPGGARDDDGRNSASARWINCALSLGTSKLLLSCCCSM